MSYVDSVHTTAMLMSVAWASGIIFTFGYALAIRTTSKRTEMAAAAFKIGSACRSRLVWATTIRCTLTGTSFVIRSNGRIDVVWTTSKLGLDLATAKVVKPMGWKGRVDGTTSVSTTAAIEFLGLYEA